MDKLVAQYTRSPHQNEFYSEQEQQELTEALPPISLNFKLPPLDNVSSELSDGGCCYGWFVGVDWWLDCHLSRGSGGGQLPC